VYPVADDHAVGGPFVLDLQHLALALQIVGVEAFGDHTVESRALERREPGACGLSVGGDTADMESTIGATRSDSLDEGLAPKRERFVDDAGVAQCKRVESDEDRRCLLGKHLHT